MTDDRTGSAGPASDSAREHWRDARLHRALDFAPDQLEVPAERTKIAIKTIANQSISTPLPTLARTEGRGWWRRLWPASPGARMPWNAAFATVLLASMVTLLWRGETVPDARPDRDTAAPVAERETRETVRATESAAGPAAQPGVASAAARGAARDAASAAAPVAAQPRIAAPMSVPKPPAVAANGATPSAAAGPKLRTDRPEPTTTTAPSAKPAPSARTAPSAQSAPLAEPSRARQETPATPEAAQGQGGARAADSTPPPLPKAAPAPPVPATQAENKAENKAVQPPPAAAAPAGAPGGAPTLSGALQRSAPAATSMLGRAETADTSARLALDQWTQARIVQGGRAFTVARDESPGLSGLLVDAVPERPVAEQGAADMAAAFGTRIELLREDRVIAVLELAPPWVRYSTRPATTARVPIARADPTALAALQAEIARLRALPR